MTEIRKAMAADLDAIMCIIEEARRTIAALGIDQWQSGSPNRSMIEEDISLGRSYCAVADGRVIGTFALIDDGEPTYERIYDGGWLTSDDAHSPAYLAIHRVAISVSSRGSGVSTRMINYAVSRAEELGRASLRIDTHKGNVVMRRMLEKHGFIHCGKIYLHTGEERVAYERRL
jgi:GNAT superfamily N-acetyltransferase